jgi:hypothetical protein
MRLKANQSVQATAAARFRFLALVVFIHSFCRSHPSPAAVPDLYRWSRHEVAFNTAWRDRFPDQALRVAAGIPRKHASGGLWPSGHYCQRYGAFPAM